MNATATPHPASDAEFTLLPADFERIRKLIYQRAGISLHAGKQAMVYSRLSRRLRETHPGIEWRTAGDGPGIELTQDSLPNAPYASDVAANGAVVLTERTDRFLLAGKPIVIRVMGVFEIRDDKIAVWRDYFDLAQFAGQMPAPAA
jgi:hypothetical protein